MKKLMSLITLAAMSAGIAVASTPVELVVPTDHIYSPKGFDTNDDSQVIISGYLPNLCHKSPKSKIEIKGNKVDIKLTSLYYQPNDYFCPEAIVPFVEVVSLGVLDKGNYEITVNGKSQYEQKSSIFVNESISSAVDERVYARVDYIDQEKATRTVTLKGYNPSDCFVLDEIKTVSNDKDTFSVLPVMKQISDFCPMKMIPFNYEYSVPKSLKAGKVLLHVRSMEGKSVNALFDNTIER